MPLSNDDLIAFVLISMWQQHTGRRLRDDVPPGALSERELIDFWADDHDRPGAPGDGRRDPAGHHRQGCDAAADKGNRS
jgi:hypothetical protein